MAEKRKAGTSGEVGISKKARISKEDNITANALVEDIVANANTYAPPKDVEEIKRCMVLLAQYAHALQQDLANLEVAQLVPKKTAEQLKTEAAKIRKAVESEIVKSMGWKPTCQTGTAKWTYDGVCLDAEVFGILMGLSGPPARKMTKISVADFEKAIGSCVREVRYASLCITGKFVKVTWSESGEFQFKGTYGKLSTRTQ